MVARAVVLKCEGVASHTVGRIIDFKDDIGSLYAAYFFGSEYLGSDLLDHSGNGRSLTNSGSTENDLFVEVGAGGRLIAPFSGQDVAAANSEITILVVHRTDATASVLLFGNYVNSSTAAIALAANNSSAVRAYAVGATSQGAQISSDADRGDQFVLSGGVWTPTTVQAHYIKNGVPTHGTTGAWTSTPPFGGADNLTIGSAVSPFTGASDIAAVLIYDTALSNGQIESVYDSLDALLPGLVLTP